jgi:hypothetical protein
MFFVLYLLRLLHISSSFHLCVVNKTLFTLRPAIEFIQNVFLYFSYFSILFILHYIISRIQMKSRAGEALETVNCCAFLKRRLTGAC